MLTTNRRCWWCNGKLMAVSHAVLSNGCWTHKVCQKAAERELKQLTAQPKSAADMDARLHDELGRD